MVSTEHAHHFYNPAEISVKVYTDKDEWEVKITLLHSQWTFIREQISSQHRGRDHNMEFLPEHFLEGT